MPSSSRAVFHAAVDQPMIPPKSFSRDEVPRRLRPRFDDLYEYYDPQADPLPQRQQQTRSSLSPPPRPASASSSGVRSLRRTPRFQARPAVPPLTPTRAPRAAPAAQPSDRRISFEQSGYTTPQSFQKLVEEDTYWPQRTTHISRGTHDAILFALEAIRKGRGVDAQPLTSDLLEERARMSELFRANAPSGATTSRAQNGGTRPVQEPTQIPSDPPRMRTPRDVMQRRQARDARKAEEEAERQRQHTREQEVRRRQQEEAAGVEGDPSRRPLGTRTEATSGRSYNIGGTAPQPAASSSRQPEMTSQPQARISSSQQPGFEPGHSRMSSSTQRNRTDAFERLNMTATVQPPADYPRAAKPQQPVDPSNVPRPPKAEPQATPQQSGAGTGFPHAFERWEQLSSQWEGLTSYWIRRLQNNANELDGKPLDQQMSRQISDLSAAGANLFHAVVELQRLRASSERKFQRWFFETRNEQEQAAERQAELERQLRAERDARLNVQTADNLDAVRQERARAEEAVREMKRELQISKEEARRAWEELGRREQEERERTIALRSGEPTLIGGVQVVPMQGLSSRQASTAHRPTTRDGTYAGSAGPSTLSGQQPLSQQPPSRSQTTTTSLDSPSEEHRQFDYQQAQSTSPTSTDPFTETAPLQQPHLRHELDTQFYSRATQRPTSSDALAVSSLAPTAPQSRNIPTTNGTSGFYQQRSPQTTIHQPLSSLPTTAPPTVASHRQQPPTSSDAGRSYIPSTTSLASGEEEYHINPDGSYTLDNRGRRIPYNQPLAQDYAPEGSDVGEMEEPEEGEEGSDEDYASDIARERAYAQQYASPSRPPIPQNQPPQQTSAPQAGSGDIPRTTSGAMPTIPQGQAATSYGAPVHQQATVPPDYEGADYGAGWEGVTPRHRHPTRLSDILEEQTSRTSPSRTSYVSGADRSRG